MLYNLEEVLALLFWDIETRPKEKSFYDLSEHLQELWIEKYHSKYVEKEILSLQKKKFIELEKSLEPNIYISPKDIKIDKEELTIEYVYQQNAPLVAEFGAIMCISMGIFLKEDDALNREIITFKGENEVEILTDFKTFMEGAYYNNEKTNENSLYKLAGYNIREFDIPFITKRFLINGITLPTQFKLRGKKPWEIVITDLCDDWRGLQREIVGLDLVCTSLGIKTPKDEFKNSEVVRLYLSGKITIDDVGRYCEKDIHAVMDIIEYLTEKKLSNSIL